MNDVVRFVRSSLAIVVEPMIAMYAVLESGVTTMPRGYGPSGIRFTSVWVATSMMLASKVHQFVTITYLPSGVVATYFGTDPTRMTLSIFSVATSTRYT